MISTSTYRKEFGDIALAVYMAEIQTFGILATVSSLFFVIAQIRKVRGTLRYGTVLAILALVISVIGILGCITQMASANFRVVNVLTPLVFIVQAASALFFFLAYFAGFKAVEHLFDQ